MPARSVCLVTLSLSEAGPGRFGRQVSVTDIYHTMPCYTCTILSVQEVATEPWPRPLYCGTLFDGRISIWDRP